MGFLRSRRGVSGIISGVFLVAVAVMIFNVLAWQFFQYDAYHRIALERDQQEWERFNERLAITSVETGTTVLNFTVKNYGPVTAHIVDLFVTFANGTHLMYSLDVWIGPGTVRRVIGPNQLKLQLTDVYNFQIGTARGNLIGLAQATIFNEPQPGGPQNMPFTFGFIREDFAYRSTSHPTWTPAWVMSSSEKDVTFAINVTNTYSEEVVIVKMVTDLTTAASRFDFVGNAQGSMTISISAPLTNAEVNVLPQVKARLQFRDMPNGNIPGKGAYFVFISLFYYFKNDDDKKIFGATVGILSMIIIT